MKTGLIFKFVRITFLMILIFIVKIQAGSENQPEKTKAEIDALIEQAGSTSPDWWDSVELNYPKTLDMNWPVQQFFPQGPGGFGFRERGGRGFPGEQRGFGFGMQQNLRMSVD